MDQLHQSDPNNWESDPVTEQLLRTEQPIHSGTPREDNAIPAEQAYGPTGQNDYQAPGQQPSPQGMSGAGYAQYGQADYPPQSAPYAANGWPNGAVNSDPPSYLGSQGHVSMFSDGFTTQEQSPPKKNTALVVTATLLAAVVVIGSFFMIWFFTHPAKKIDTDVLTSVDAAKSDGSSSDQTASAAETTAAASVQEETATVAEPEATAASVSATAAAGTVPATTAAPPVPKTAAVPPVPKTTLAPPVPKTTAAPPVPSTTAAPAVPKTTAAPVTEATTVAVSMPSTAAEVLSYYCGAYNKIATEASAITRTYDYTSNYKNILNLDGNDTLESLAATLMKNFMAENTASVAGSAGDLPPVGLTTLSIPVSKVSSATCKDKGNTFQIVIKSTGTDDNYEADLNPGEGSAGLIGPLLRTEEVIGAFDSTVSYEGLHAYYATATVTATVDKSTGRITQLAYETPCILHFDQVNAAALVTVENCDIGLLMQQTWKIDY